MKMFAILASLFFACFTTAEAARLGNDRTITRVVKLLEGMLEKSKADADADRVTYAKFKCYCDTQKETKTNEIEELTTDIGILESKIEELKGSTGSLSTKAAKDQADMAANQQARVEAQDLRNDENAAFLAQESDLTAAIAQMKDAVRELSDVGADQTRADAAGADHTYAMGGYNSSMLVLRATVKKALAAASSLAPTAEKRKTVTSLLQAPFTGTYTSQSGEVVGILKSMRDTFEDNLASARSLEASQLAAFNKFMATKLEAYNNLSAAYDEKQGAMGDNDGELASSQQLLATAEQQKSTKEDFLAQLEPMCEDRTKEYEQRKALRANEDAAIAEAISILNSDAAFETFGKMSATSIGATSFLQVLSSERRNPLSTRARAQEVLRNAGSSRLVQVASSLASGNPFDIVLAEIKKMIDLIAEEGREDAEKRAWCRSERAAQQNALGVKEAQITALSASINQLTDEIENPQTGLKVMIANDEQSLSDNLDTQKSSTETRQQESSAYKEDISVLQESEELLGRAIKVLSDYYATLEPHQLDQAKEVQTLAGESQAAPSTWEAEMGYKGQSTSGNSAVTMLEFILEETKKEEEEAHTAENQAQHAYEDQMASLKSAEAQLQVSIAGLKATLAEKERDLFDAKKDLQKTEAEKAAILEYLASIKPGCDFIEANFDLRETSRASETTALTNAETLLKGTPTYIAAEAASHNETLGDCLGVCAPSEDHVNCKACLAKVTVPGYCAGHPGTLGC